MTKYVFYGRRRCERERARRGERINEWKTPFTQKTIFNTGDSLLIMKYGFQWICYGKLD